MNNESKNENNCELNIQGNVSNVIGQVIIDTKKTDNLPKLDDKTNLSTHFNLISQNIKLSEVFVDGCYEIYENNQFDEKKLEHEQKLTLSNCIKIFDSQRILLIEGEYGTGKTALMKMIQNKLIESNNDTLFLDATFFTKANSFESLISHISSIKNILYVFIDSVDDLTYVVFDKTNGVIHLLDNITKMTNDYKNVYFIINSRPNLYIQSKNEMVAQYLYFYSNQNNNITKLQYIRTRGFKPFEANSFFENLNPFTKSPTSAPLSTTDIKKLHKKSQSSYKNPLFDYCIGTYYYCHNCSLPTNILKIYSYFVETTIGGKFKGEKVQGSPFIEKIRSQYKKVLQSLAKEMIINKSMNIDYKDEDLDFSTEYKNTFCIKMETFKKCTEELYEEYKKLEEVVHKGYYDASFLNCYFFKVLCVNNGQVLVSFSDDNIMCYLVAETTYEHLIDQILETYNSKSYKKLLNELKGFELHPLTMDFIVLLLSQLNKEQTEMLVSRLKEMIDNFNSCKDTVTIPEIKLQLMLQILFIKLNKKSYKALSSLHFFKSFDKLCKTAKDFQISGQHIDGKHRYLAERYFMGSTFIECCFRRLNLKYYNFKNTYIGDSSFEQCKLDGNIFEESFLKNSCFSLCILSNISFFFTISQNITFDNCKMTNCDMQNVNLTNPSVASIIFKKCSIENMNIIDLKSSGISITFEKCFIKDICIKDCSHNNRISIINCVVEKSINVTNSKIRIKDQDNLLFQQRLLEPDSRSVCTISC